MTSRREFLKHSTLLGFGASVPTFLGRTALAADPAGRPGAKDTILVVVQLTGGNDGLNTVIPFKDPAYYKLRPTIAIPKDQVRVKRGGSRLNRLQSCFIQVVTKEVGFDTRTLQGCDHHSIPGLA